MLQFMARRLLQAIPQLFAISLILFLLMQAIGDPLSVRGIAHPTQQRSQDIERLRRQLGLDKPVLVQYVIWLIGNDWMQIDLNGDGSEDAPGTAQGVLRGDWGNSLVERRPALTVIVERLPNTLLLMLSAELLIVLLSLGIGIYSALNQYSLFDYVVTTLAFVGYSLPIFWLALMLIYIFAVNFKRWGLPYLPTGSMYDLAVGPTLGEVVWHMVLPVTAITVIGVAEYSRYVRASMLEVLDENYIQFARAKGLRETLIVTRHALKNALLPFVTLVGLDLPFLLAGAVVTEEIFSWPGMGRLFIEHLERADYPVLMGILMLITVALVIFQMLTDITYAALDPRIRLEAEEE